MDNYLKTIKASFTLVLALYAEWVKFEANPAFNLLLVRGLPSSASDGEESGVAALVQENVADGVCTTEPWVCSAPR